MLQRKRTRITTAAGMTAVLATFALTAASCGGPPPETAESSSETVFINGKVVQYTDEGEGVAFAEAVLVRDGLIKYVGDSKTAQEQASEAAEVIDLEGKMMLPGLGDGHSHGAISIDCDFNYTGGTVDEVLGLLKECLLNDEQKEYLDSDYVLEARNFTGNMEPAGTFLDAAILDRLSADPSDDPFGTGTTRPIIVENLDGHKYSANTAAIEAAGVTKDTVEPPDGFIGRDADGNPNGQFADYSPDFGERIPETEDAAYEQFVKNLDTSNSMGITQVLRASGYEADLKYAKRAIDEGRMNLNLNQAWGWNEFRGLDEAESAALIADINRLRDEYDGYSSEESLGELTMDTVKISCDGVTEYPGQTAAMIDPYRINIGTAENPQWVDGPSRGEDPSCEDSLTSMSMLDADHWNIHIHAIGDRASRVALDNFEAALNENEDWDRRHTISHLEVVREEDAARFGPLGVVASFSFQWAVRDSFSIGGSEGYMDDSLIENKYPAKSIADSGAVLAAGSDWPVTALLPFESIETAVDRQLEPDELEDPVYAGPLAGHQAITLAESLKAHTIGVAYQLHQEDWTGSIEEGKSADLIVIDQDLFEIVVSDISDTRVLMTMFKGEPVYSDPDEPVM